MITRQQKNTSIHLQLNPASLRWLVVGGGGQALRQVKILLQHAGDLSITVVAEEFHPAFERLAATHENLCLVEKLFEIADRGDADAAIVATGHQVVDEKIAAELQSFNLLVSIPAHPSFGDFLVNSAPVQKTGSKYWLNDRSWKQLTTRLIIGFSLATIGHVIISYLPLPPVKEVWLMIKPHINTEFFLFILAGFLAQMVDGVLSMGYGVTSATCLMSFGVNPVAMSAAIHTSEIFTTGISGYSHYRFGNVNKKLFRLLVVPGVFGAIGGALLLVYLGERYSNLIMPVVAVYAGFLGLRILFKAFKEPVKGKKVKRIGLLAWAGGFLDSFGGGGWGPIVTSSLMAKGRSPKYTVGSVSLTEFFVTLSSAITFFIMVGVSHLAIVIALMIGGSIAAPIAAKLAGKLPRKAMMIAVGVMVIVWCVRMIFKSL